MGFAVFIHRADSIYDDSPSERYQFPPQYLERVKACVGDWIIYLEPSKVPKTRGYFGVAKVKQVVPDPGTSSMYLALIEPGSYLDFAKPVPFRGPAGIIERGILNDEGRISGRAQAAVRQLSFSDFLRIIEAGLNERLVFLPRNGDPSPDGFEDEQTPFIYDQDRIRVERLSSRTLRDGIFRRVVLDAYDERCAITGLKLINGGGRAEVEAAHIKSVQAKGPDIVTNGLALSGTAHWMFDRGLISLADDLEILVSRKVNDQNRVRSMINSTGRALSPQSPSQRPHPSFLKWHRDHHLFEL